MHYHVHAGMHGCMPTYSSMHAYKKHALADLRRYVESITDSCEADHECTYTPRTDWYVGFRDGHGVEYVEVTLCTDDLCSDDE